MSWVGTVTYGKARARIRTVTLKRVKREPMMRSIGGMPGVHDHENGYGPCSCEPGPCPECKARRQWNVDGQIVHARAGSIECPPAPFSEAPVEALLGVLTELTNMSGMA